MKTLLLVVVIFFASCSGEDDPTLKYDCEQLKKDYERAHVDYQGATNVTLLPSSPPSVVKEWQLNVETKKDIYIEKYKLWSANCH